MRKLKLVFEVFIVMLFLGMKTVSAQEREPQTVIIRTTEALKGAGPNAEMIIITPSGEKQVIQLSGYKPTNYNEVSGDNGVIIQQEITKWQKQGFRVVSASTSGSTSGSSNIEKIFIIMTKE
jgi:hypothetical protein